MTGPISRRGLLSLAGGVAAAFWWKTQGLANDVPEVPSRLARNFTLDRPVTEEIRQT